VVLGLIVGKPLGIAGAVWLAVRLGLGRFPSGVSWPQMSGAALFGGIGFTMSLFVATLAFADPEAVAAIKLAVLAGSALAATAGLLVLGLATRESG
jgi:NhaA family Na+:H+ antiporter